MHLYFGDGQLHLGNRPLCKSQKQHKLPPHKPAHLLFFPPHKPAAQKQESVHQPHRNITFFYRYSGPTPRRLTNRAAGNICFKKLGLRHFAGRESQIGGSVLRRKFSANIPQLRKAKARYVQPCKTNK